MIHLVGLPYEGPEDFLRGTAMAPSRLRWAMESIEDYSVYQRRSVPRFQDHGDLYPVGETPEERLQSLQERLKPLLQPGERWVFLGGDHSITYATVAALLPLYPGLQVVHLDAHLDRREAFFGNRWSHASVIRRLEDLLGDPTRIHTLGYRSRAPEEPERGTPFRVLEPLRALAERLAPPVYLTLDFDVLDPSEFPAVGNPEPGGVSFQELLEALQLLRGKLVAADLVEYNPLASSALFPAVTGALLLREVLILLDPAHDAPVPG